MQKDKQHWFSFIGPVEKSEISRGGDFPLRMAVQEKFDQIFPENEEYTHSSGWGVSDEMRNRISRMMSLHLTDPSGKTLEKIDAALDENTERLKSLESKMER